jgi:hypothetical protein
MSGGGVRRGGGGDEKRKKKKRRALPLRKKTKQRLNWCSGRAQSCWRRPPCR